MKRFFTVLLIMTVIITAAAANGTAENTDGSALTYRQGSGLRSGRNQENAQGQGRNAGTRPGYGENDERGELVHNEIGSGQLSDADKAGLLLMIEEEKLARDVYSALYEEWNLPIFRNIAESEQQHMDSIAFLMEAYSLDLPVETKTTGLFEDEALQQLYDELVEQGSNSLSEALKTGATVEDLDIYDLQRLMAETDNDEVKLLYQNLMKGSRNHIRSFTTQIERNGEEYSPVYIDSAYYEKIIKLNRETAPITDPDYSL